MVCAPNGRSASSVSAMARARAKPRPIQRPMSFAPKQKKKPRPSWSMLPTQAAKQCAALMRRSREECIASPGTCVEQRRLLLLPVSEAVADKVDRAAAEVDGALVAAGLAAAVAEAAVKKAAEARSEEHTSELQSHSF